MQLEELSFNAAECAICVAMLVNETCRSGRLCSTQIYDVSSPSTSSYDSDTDIVTTIPAALHDLIEEVPSKCEESVNVHYASPVIEPKITEEMDVESELPPIEQLCITVDQTVRMDMLGRVKCIIDVGHCQSIVVESESQAKVLNEGTVLFTDNRQSVGRIAEVFGPVSQPFYVVTPQWTEIVGFAVNSAVFYASLDYDLTRFVFTKDIQDRGSDASWYNNEEPPKHALEFSDDEKERAFKRTIRRRPTCKRSHSSCAYPTDSTNVQICASGIGSSGSFSSPVRQTLLSNVAVFRHATPVDSISRPPLLRNPYRLNCMPNTTYPQIVPNQGFTNPYQPQQPYQGQQSLNNWMNWAVRRNPWMYPPRRSP